ncbi:MAG: hypothetical protein AAGF95_35660, partial [Chloroflexota bacterium]
MGRERNRAKNSRKFGQAFDVMFKRSSVAAQVGASLRPIVRLCIAEDEKCVCGRLKHLTTQLGRELWIIQDEGSDGDRDCARL